MELQHLSYSSISTWLTCPRSWHFRYVDKVQVPTSAALIFGSAIHNVVEEYIAMTQPRALVDLWPVRWQAELESKEIQWGDDTPEGLYNDGIRLLSDSKVVAAVDRLQPMHDADGSLYVEYAVTLRVPEVSVPIIGYIDLIAADGVPCDLKTSARSWNTEKAQNEIQPLFYLAALMQGGHKDHRLRFRHIIFVKTKTPQVQIIESAFTFGSIFWLLEMIRTVWQAIEGGHYPPNPIGWKCSDKWCEYWSMCRGKV